MCVDDTKVSRGFELDFQVFNRVLKFRDRVCVPQNDDLRTQICQKCIMHFISPTPVV